MDEMGEIDKMDKMDKMDKTKNSFFALVFRQRYIKRWGLMRNVKDENLAEHSAQTAMIAHALALISNKRLGGSVDADAVALAALYHDASEVYTGDLPTPIKYFDSSIRDSYKKIEKNAVEKLLDSLPSDLKDEYRVCLEPSDDVERLVKAADKLCAYLKCVEELDCGNREFTDAKEATARAMSELHCPELDIFVTEFLPAFSETVDRL